MVTSTDYETTAVKRIFLYSQIPREGDTPCDGRGRHRGSTEFGQWRRENCGQGSSLVFLQEIAGKAGQADLGLNNLSESFQQRWCIWVLSDAWLLVWSLEQASDWSRRAVAQRRRAPKRR